MSPKQTLRLDAGESLFFERELENIDKVAYDHVYPQHKARQIIPLQGGISETDEVYTYRMYDKVGHAAFVASMATDLPRTDAFGVEVSHLIKPFGAAFGYDFLEIKQAARLGRPLDAMKASSNRFAVEEKIDEVLAFGDTTLNLEGILNLTGAQTYTPGAKTAGGNHWGTAAAPNATGEEVALDLMGMASARATATKGIFSGFTMVLPISQYEYAATKRLGDGSDVTALQFALKTSEHINRIVQWHRCADVPGVTGGRIALFPSDARVVSAIVPMEWTPFAPQDKNLTKVINCLSRCGGVVVRYTPAVAYMDGTGL